MKSAPPDVAYTYVIVRSDLPNPHLTVQAVHAGIAAAIAFGNPDETHPHLVICTVPDEKSLVDAFERLKQEGVPCCAWTEDDMDNQYTAVATAPLRGVERKPLRRFPLLK